MKKTLLIAFTAFALISCTSERSIKIVAEKALSEFGNGKYAGMNIGGKYMNFDLAYLFDSPYFADYEIENYLAKGFINTGQIRSAREVKDIFFETDILFERIVFTTMKGPNHMDIYRTSFFSQYEKNPSITTSELELLEKVHEKKMESHKDAPGFYAQGSDCCYVEHQSVPYFTLTYKLDNKYIATVTVAKMKGKRPEVTSVFIR